MTPDPSKLFSNRIPLLSSVMGKGLTMHIKRDIFTPHFLGATLVIPPPDVIAQEPLAEWMKEHGVTVTYLTPAMGQILVGGAATQFPSLQNAFCVGDVLTKKDCKKLLDLALNATLVNLYGSTESQRAVSFFEDRSKLDDPTFLDHLPDIIPIGQGMLHVQLLVFNREDRTRLCGVGEQGELFLRAGGLAEGYLGDDDDTRNSTDLSFFPIDLLILASECSSVTTRLLRELMRLGLSCTRDHEIAYIEPVILVDSVPTEVSSVQAGLIHRSRFVAFESSSARLTYNYRSTNFYANMSR
jgi:acyl-CoA synthetase (AMP-forming)/AMP-acid ligase II